MVTESNERDIYEQRMNEIGPSTAGLGSVIAGYIYITTVDPLGPSRLTSGGGRMPFLGMYCWTFQIFLFALAAYISYFIYPWSKGIFRFSAKGAKGAAFGALLGGLLWPFIFYILIIPTGLWYYSRDVYIFGSWNLTYLFFLVTLFLFTYYYSMKLQEGPEYLSRGFDKKNTLDKFGPYTAAFGALIGTWIQIIFYLNFRALLPWVDWILAYALCTCTHRKHIYSSGAFGGMVGAIIGEMATTIVWLVVILLLEEVYPYQVFLQFRSFMVASDFYSYTLQMIFAPLFAFIISRRMCNRAIAKEQQVRNM